MICYAFSPDLLDASERDLKDFLKVLSQYFPKTANGEGGHKLIPNDQLLNGFNLAYSNVCKLIADRQAKKRHYQIFWMSVLTLLVLVVTLANTICVQTKSNVQNTTQGQLKR